MKSIISKLCTQLSRQLRHCLSCKEWPVSVWGRMCSLCWQKELDVAITGSASFAYPFPVRKIWTWKKDQPELYRLLNSLKGGGDSRSFDRLAQIFLLGIDSEQFRKAVIVPCPPQGRKHQDHAWQWARSLSTLTGCPLEDRILSWDVENGSPQKDKDLQQRREVKMKLLQKKGYESIIFADDVITSGSTAQSALDALKGVRKFQVWVVAERAKVI